MHKVLLVDDEMFVRKGLYSLIDWEALGFEVCGEAENGEEALAVISERKPDLVITDIRMPVLDGLELIRSVVTAEEERAPSFIIISGYHDFSYAQQALRYGVHDYVLKPIDDEELQAALKALSSKLGMKKSGGGTYPELLRGGTAPILDVLIHGSVQEEDVPAYAAALHMEQARSFTYVLIEVQRHPDTGAEEDERLGREVRDVLGRIGGRPQGLPLHEHFPGRYGTLVDDGLLQPYGGSCGSFLQALHSRLARAADTAVSLYAGITADSLGRVKESYRTASDALAYKYAENGAPLIEYERVQGTPLSYFDIDQDFYTRLLEQLEENELDACRQTVEAMLQHYRVKRFASGAVVNSVTRCVIGIVNVIRGMEGDESELASLRAIMAWQERPGGPDSLRAVLLGFITEASGCIDRLRREQAKGGIEKIRRFIESRYMENISLKSIAAKFYMNPVYLGQLFRKTYGVYFNDFLLSIRVGEAKRLLRQTDLRMYEVAERVGFQNADYFVTQFEKLEGLSPTEYRKQLIGRA